MKINYVKIIELKNMFTGIINLDGLKNTGDDRELNQDI